MEKPIIKLLNIEEEKREGKMKIFIISDTHFNHKNIIKYCDRNFNSVEEMNEFIIDKWNSEVSHEDIVLHLGDFAKGNKEEIRRLRKRLQGTIILIKGNHDYKIDKYCGFFIIEGTLQIGHLLLSHYPLKKIPRGFKNIHGHIHNKKSYSGINVSVEEIDYTPIELIINKKQGGKNGKRKYNKNRSRAS